MAVARDPNGKIMAFANLWILDNHEELSIDLMRYDLDSPRGIMDYLFASLMLWGQDQCMRSLILAWPRSPEDGKAFSCDRLKKVFQRYLHGIFSHIVQFYITSKKKLFNLWAGQLRRLRYFDYVLI